MMTSGTQGDGVKVAILNPGLILPRKWHPEASVPWSLLGDYPRATDMTALPLSEALWALTFLSKTSS